MCYRITTGILSLLLCLSLWLPRAEAQRAAVLTAPPMRGLVAWYWAEPGLTSGRLWYDLLGRYHGTLTNMGTTGAASGWQASTSRSGGPYHLRFDGVDDYVVLSPVTALLGGRYTIAFWVNTPGSTTNFLLDFSTNSGGNRLVLSLMGGNWGGPSQAISLLVNGGVSTLGAASSIPASGWTHIAVTLDSVANVSKGYVNCRVTGTGSYGETFVTPVTGPFHVGTRNTASSGFYDGALKDLRLATVVATPAEICQMMRTTPTAPTETALSLATSGPSGPSGSFLPFFSQP